MHALSEAAITRTFKLSRRLSVEITVGAAGLVCEWNPDIPQRLTEKERRRYVTARDEMIARLAESLGLSQVLVVELPPTTRPGEGG